MSLADSMSESRSTLENAAKLSVAPMMAWTDRHCRWFLRQMSKHTLLYTEMVTSASLVYGNALYQLEYSLDEHPLALQIGGSDPNELAKACELAAPYQYPEINLNVGCPSDRVQSGCFGAVLMKDPALVAHCIKAMQSATDAEITVKCRIGVDDQDPEQTLPHFLETLSQAGIRRVIIHARKAWLQGLSPKDNRTIPPLDYALVKRMKERFPDLHISLNGGIVDLQSALEHSNTFDGVMIGRAAYNAPYSILADADQIIFNATGRSVERDTVARNMIPYIATHCQKGGKAWDITRHMLGLFAGQPGARTWRRVLSAGTKAGPEIVEMALSEMP